MRHRISLRVFLCSLIVAAASLAVFGCTSARNTQPAGTNKSTDPYRVEKEGKVPPLSQTEVRREVDREEKVEELPVNEEPISSETVEPEAPPPAPASGPATLPSAGETPQKMMDGFRIQVFATGSEAAARSAMEAAGVKIGVPAYVEFAGGVYKVRVGDCPSRGEAEALLAKCREAGYGDAWIVACRIMMTLR